MGLRSPKGLAGHEIIQVWIKIKDSLVDKPLFLLLGGILCPLIPLLPLVS